MPPGHGPRRSEAGERKVRRQRTDQGEPARSFDTFMADLGTLGKHETRVPGSDVTFARYTLPTPLQQKAFGLLGVPYRMYPVHRTPRDYQEPRNDAENL